MLTAFVSVAAVAYIYASGVHLTMFCIHTFVPQVTINCRYMWQKRIYKDNFQIILCIGSAFVSVVSITI
jgi:hypothetical protein